MFRMDPDTIPGHVEPVASNPFRLEPLLRHHTYPMPAWERLIDKDVLRTFIAPPFILEKVTLTFSSKSGLPHSSRQVQILLLTCMKHSRGEATSHVLRWHLRASKKSGRASFLSDLAMLIQLKLDAAGRAKVSQTRVCLLTRLGQLQIL